MGHFYLYGNLKKGYCDAYNKDRPLVYERNLYIKRFEEAWFSYKLKQWMFRAEFDNSFECSIDVKNFDNEIRNYLPKIQLAFTHYWFKQHQKYCKNHNECKSFSNYFQI